MIWKDKEIFMPTSKNDTNCTCLSSGTSCFHSKLYYCMFSQSVQIRQETYFQRYIMTEGCSQAPTQAGEILYNFLVCLSTFKNLPLSVSEQGLIFPGKQQTLVASLKMTGLTRIWLKVIRTEHTIKNGVQLEKKAI